MYHLASFLPNFTVSGRSLAIADFQVPSKPIILLRIFGSFESDSRSFKCLLPCTVKSTVHYFYFFPINRFPQFYYTVYGPPERIFSNKGLVLPIKSLIYFPRPSIVVPRITRILISICSLQSISSHSFPRSRITDFCLNSTALPNPVIWSSAP